MSALCAIGCVWAAQSSPLSSLACDIGHCVSIVDSSVVIQITLKPVVESADVSCSIRTKEVQVMSESNSLQRAAKKWHVSFCQNAIKCQYCPPATDGCHLRYGSSYRCHGSCVQISTLVLLRSVQLWFGKFSWGIGF